MSNSNETLDLTRGVDTVRRSASESFSKLKAATMFVGKQTQEAAAPAPANSNAAPAKRKPAGPAASVLSINVEVAGTIVAPDEMHVFGTIEGNVRAASLVVCAGGYIRGEVVAETVTVHGTVDGRIHGQTVQLAAGGIVRGDIIHSALGIDTAAIFEGASKRTQDPMGIAPQVVAIKREAAE
jgi:cytoskeletal protein CcmA (bactofilin family)